MDTGDILGGIYLDIFSGHSSKCIFFPSVVYTNGSIVHTVVFLVLFSYSQNNVLEIFPFQCIYYFELLYSIPLCRYTTDYLTTLLMDI